MGGNAELLKVYVWNDELMEGRPLHEVIVDRVKEFDRYGLAAARIYSSPAAKGCGSFPAENSMPGGSQVVIEILAGSSTIEQIQLIVKQLVISGWMIRAKVDALCR